MTPHQVDNTVGIQVNKIENKVEVNVETKLATKLWAMLGTNLEQS